MEQNNSSLLINLITTEAQLQDIIIKCLLIIEANKQGDNEANKPKEELLTVKQIANFFQVSQTTIHSWKNAGLLPYVRIKSRIRFKKSEVLKLNEKRRFQK